MNGSEVSPRKAFTGASRMGFEAIITGPGDITIVLDLESCYRVESYVREP